MLSLRCIAVLVVIRLEVCTGETNQFRQGEATFSISNSSGLYGYDISLLEVNNQTSLIVGSPPSSPTSGHGSFLDCQIPRSLKNSTTAADVQCLELPRATTSPSDNIGQSISTNPATGEVLACSTTSVQICTDLNALPGFCYVLDTKPTTPKWKFLDHAKTRGCPVTNTVDVLFVLDGSGSVGTGNFKKIKEWTNRVVDKLKVDKGIAKVAVIQFGREAVTEITFDKYQKVQPLQRAIEKITYQSGGYTRTVTALKEAGKELKNSDRFESESNNQVMIILTDGGSTQGGVLDAAHNLRDLGVVTYSVGVGSLDVGELRELATGDRSSDERVYKVDNFDNLGSIVDDLQQQIESFIPNEGAGNLTVEFAQAGFDVAFSKNRSVK